MKIKEQDCTVVIYSTRFGHAVSIKEYPEFKEEHNSPGEALVAARKYIKGRVK